jgi:hypothetical protein
MPTAVRDVYNEARRVSPLSRKSGAGLLRLGLQLLIDDLEPSSADIKTLATLAARPNDHDDDDVQVLMTALGRVLPLYPDASLALAAQLLDLGAAEVGEVVAAAAHQRSRVSRI